MIDEAAVVGFLIEIGRWAKSELSERWTIRRKQQHADLFDQGQATTEFPGLIQDATVGRGAREAERTWTLIQRKRDAVYRAQNAKLADGEERGRQELTQAAYEERTIKHDGNIKRLLNEIEGDLENLGFIVERIILVKPLSVRIPSAPNPTVSKTVISSLRPRALKAPSTMPSVSTDKNVGRIKKIFRSSDIRINSTVPEEHTSNEYEWYGFFFDHQWITTDVGSETILCQKIERVLENDFERGVEANVIKDHEYRYTFIEVKLFYNEENL